jgi:hypothetical protein
MTEVEQVFWSIPKPVIDVVKTAASGAAVALCKKYVHGC